MTRQLIQSAIRLTIPAAALLLVSLPGGCTQKGSDEIERGAAPSQHPLRPEPPVAVSPAKPQAPSTRPVDAAGHPVIVQFLVPSVVKHGAKAGALTIADLPEPYAGR